MGGRWAGPAVGVAALLVWAMCGGRVEGEAPRGAATVGATQAATRAYLGLESTKAVRAMYAALQAGDLAAAKGMIAAAPQPVTDLDRRLARRVKEYANPQVEVAVLDVKESGDVAVAIVGQSEKGGAKTFQAEEWYLVRQGGQWKLLGNFGDFELPGYGFDKAQIEAYKSFESWVEKREGELRKELTGCDC